MYEHMHGALFCVNFIFGNLLAVNTCFHYWMGTTTNPGEPPKVYKPLKKKKLVISLLTISFKISFIK